MAEIKHVAVIMGGWAAERPVSLSTGAECAQALEAAGHRVSRVDVDRNIAQTLIDLRPDVVFNALHGPQGEDGTIQGLLEVLQIPYTHSGVLASALAMNKVQAKQVAAANGIPVAEHRIVHRSSAATQHIMVPPYVVKPVAEGSSFGVIIIRTEQSHPPQSLTRADWEFGEEIMVERFVDGRELTCAVMGSPGEEQALGVTEIVPIGQEFYDFDAKYAEGGSKHVVPAELKPNIYQKVCTLSLEAHRALGCRGVTRSDFRYDERGGGEVIWLEINTQPGMTRTSLVPELAVHKGMSFVELVDWLVEDASCGR